MSDQSTAAASVGIRGGNATVFVSDLDSAVRFYTETLGLQLQYRAGEHFAMIDAGNGLCIGLHPPAKNSAAPGTSGGIQIGLGVERPIADVVRDLSARGVTFKSIDGQTIIDDGTVKLAFFGDADGNELYLCEVQHP